MNSKIQTDKKPQTLLSRGNDSLDRYHVTGNDKMINNSIGYI